MESLRRRRPSPLLMDARRLQHPPHSSHPHYPNERSKPAEVPALAPGRCILCTKKPAPCAWCVSAAREQARQDAWEATAYGPKETA